MFLKAARRQNVGAFLMSGLRHYVEDHKQGAFALSAPTDDVLEVTGRPAEDFETTARRYAARPEAQRTLGNWPRAFVDSMRDPVSQGYNPAQTARHGASTTDLNPQEGNVFSCQITSIFPSF
jgi:hypothetical protein